MSNWQTLADDLAAQGYVATPELAMAVHLAVALGRPLLLEGAAGVGKTEIAKALAAARSTNLIRLQCYEGLDANHAIYEWNYQRQLLTIRSAAEGGETGKSVEDRIFSRDFLLERPLLAALRHPNDCVLLIDEVDRSDHEFEAFLLEFLSDFQISIPETGTVRATNPPVVVLTSNRTRDLHEALRRRCVYHWINYPHPELEAAIVMARASSVAQATANAVVSAVNRLREQPLVKPPGVAETVEWSEAATLLNAQGATWPDAFKRSIGVALKDHDDLEYTRHQLDDLLAGTAA